MPGPAVVPALLLSFLFPAQVPAAAGPPPQRVRPFEIGSVNLLSLAATLPPEEVSDPTGRARKTPASLRDLREVVDRFLERDVKSGVLSARLRETAARWSAVSGGAAGPRSSDLVQRTVQDSISPPRSWGGDGWAGLLTALVPVSIAVLSPNKALGEARTCLSFLEGYEQRVRAFRDGLPATDEAATPDLLLQWKRLAGELSANVSCRPLRRAERDTAEPSGLVNELRPRPPSRRSSGTNGE